MIEMKLTNGEIRINGNVLSFKFDIAEYIELSKILVIRLKVPVDVVFNENVFGIGTDGKIVWQIAHKEFLHKNSPYINMKKLDNNKINLSNWDGTQILIEAITGNILEEKWVK